MNAKLFFLAVLALVPGIQSFAQFNYFPFYSPDSTERILLSETCSEKVSRSFVLPDDVNSAYKKQFKHRKEESADYVKSLVKYTGTQDPLLYPFVQSVYSKITEGNPLLAGYTVVLSNWPVMNAAFVGGHVIVMYAPLLSRMENESQVAAVLCHELAHGELDHVQKNIQSTLAQLYNKEFQKELKKTMKEEFNVQAKINLLTMRFAFNTSFHSRALEKSADSLGYLFLMKTNYDANQALSTLEVLKHIDEPVTKELTDYSMYFKCPSSAFDFTGIKPYKASSIFSKSAEDVAKEEAFRDSLRTHPDCDKRMTYISDLMKAKPPHPGKPCDEKLYAKVKWAGGMEMINAFFQYDYYDYSLFNALLYLDMAKDNEFLKFMVSLNGYKLVEAIRNHELSDYVSNYSDENEPQLNNLLFLLNTIRLSEFTGLVNCYNELNAPDFHQEEFTLAANYCISKLKDDGKSDSWLTKYKSKYANGRFADLLGLNEKTKKKKK